MIASMASAKNTTESVCIAQLSAAPKDINSLCASGVKACKLCVL